MKKKQLLKSTAGVGLVALGGRLLAFFYDLFLARFLGVGPIPDAFFVSIRVPDTLRRVFADTSISAALVPSIVKMLKTDDKKRVGYLITTALIFFSVILLCLVSLVVCYPAQVLGVLAPGLNPDQAFYATKFLPVVFPVIVLYSACSVFSSALKSVNHFSATSFGPWVFSLFMIAAIAVIIKTGLPLVFLCYAVLVAVVLKLLIRVVVYLWYDFRLGVSWQGVSDFALVLAISYPLLLGVGVGETNMLLQNMIGSFLPEGQITLLHYAYRIYFLPLTTVSIMVNATVFPLLSRTFLSAPMRLSFYLLELAKVFLWFFLPTMFFYIFSSHTLFKFFFASRVPGDKIFLASQLLCVLSSAMVIACFNRTVFNLFYACSDTKTPTIINTVATVGNLFGNWIGIKFYGVLGIVVSNSFFIVVSTPFLLFYLQKKHQVNLSVPHLWSFFSRLVLQLSFFLSLFVMLAFATGIVLKNFCVGSLASWHDTLEFLSLVVLYLAMMCGMFFSRNLFGIRCYFFSWQEAHEE